MAVHTPVLRLGMRGTGSFGADMRPKNWRQELLRQYPNGAAPLTAMLSVMGKEKTDDPEFNWWEKDLLQKATDLTAAADICTDVALAIPVANNNSAVGAVLYVKLAEIEAQKIRGGNQVVLIDTGHYTVFVNAVVDAVVLNGANSYIAIRLLKADTGDAVYGLISANRMIVASDINPEGGAMPEPIVTSPTKIYNYTQIMRTSVATTRTALRTKLRTADNYQEAKREAFELHMIDAEWNFFFGTRTENTSPVNNQPERTTMGVREFISSYYSANIVDFRFDAEYPAATWLEKGHLWIRKVLKAYYTYAKSSMNDKVCFCGYGAVDGIASLAEHYGYTPLTWDQAAYGVSVLRWVTPFGELYLKPHPLFSREPAMQDSIIMMELPNLKYRFIDDTYFKPDDRMKKSGPGAIDGMQEEWLTEAGLELHWANTFMWMSGVGQDNEL